jgi:hypothetical protein
MNSLSELRIQSYAVNLKAISGIRNVTIKVADGTEVSGENLLGEGSRLERISDNLHLGLPWGASGHEQWWA